MWTIAVSHAIHMVNQISSCASIMHFIQHHIDALTSCQFGGRNEVCIGGNQNYLINLPLEGHRSDIKS